MVPGLARRPVWGSASAMAQVGGRWRKGGETGGVRRRGHFYWEVGDCNFRKAEEYGVYGYRINLCIPYVHRL